jgi:RHS repeat-associated protein
VSFNTSKAYSPGPSFGNIEVVSQPGGTPTSATYAYTGTDADGALNMGPDAPAAVGQASLQYGAFGRIVSKGTGETFGYDLFGRLTSVTRSVGASESIAYDPFGQLLWRKVGTSESWYLGKHATVTGLGGVVAVDLHVEVNGARVASVRVGASPRTLFLHRDRLTSVVETSTGGGVPGASYRYQPHGALASAAGDAGPGTSELGYAGAVRLTGGLLLMGARVYDPALKIFLQPDPLSPHQYTYADGDPVNKWDPTGLKTSKTDYDSRSPFRRDGDGGKSAGGEGAATASGQGVVTISIYPDEIVMTFTPLLVDMGPGSIGLGNSLSAVAGSDRTQQGGNMNVQDPRCPPGQVLVPKDNPGWIAAVGLGLGVAGLLITVVGIALDASVIGAPVGTVFVAAGVTSVFVGAVGVGLGVYGLMDYVANPNTCKPIVPLPGRG